MSECALILKKGCLPTAVSIFLLVCSMQAFSQPQLILRYTSADNWPQVELSFKALCNGARVLNVDRSDIKISEEGVDVPDFNLSCPDTAFRFHISVAMVFDEGVSMAAGNPSGLTLAKAAGLDRNAVKFAYFFLSPPAGLAKTRPVTPSEEQQTRLRRVVSDPMLNKAGRLRYVLCAGGRLETISARADDPEAKARGFMELRRGDRIRALGLEPRAGGGYGLLPDSTLVIHTRAPEAAP